MASGSMAGGGEPVDVLRRHGEPAHFIWQGRLYRICEVIAHRVCAGAAALKQDPAAALGSATSAVLSRERGPGYEQWSVRASAGREAEVGAYELWHDVREQSWLLVCDGAQRPPPDLQRRGAS